MIAIHELEREMEQMACNFEVLVFDRFNKTSPRDTALFDEWRKAFRAALKPGGDWGRSQSLLYQILKIEG